MSVGFRTGSLSDGSRPDWDGAGPRPISWAAWYPAEGEGAETLLSGVGPAASWFQSGAVVRDAPVRRAGGPWPVVLISHGTGGSALAMGWLGHRLAQRGCVALAPNHHGNTAMEPYRPEGFLCWWERTRDLSVLLDALLAEDGFGQRLDTRRSAVVGFSLGGHTALSLLGGVTDMALFSAWASAAGVRGGGPREFPDLADHVPRLMADSAVFRASWDRQSALYTDLRVRAGLLLAPAPPVRAITEASLHTIAAPVAIMSGGADMQAPVEVGGVWLKERLPRCTLEIVDPYAGHFVFLPEATPTGRLQGAELCVDPPGLDRRAIHDAVAAATEQLCRP